MKKPRRSQQDLADEYRLTLDQIKKLKQEGVDVYDPLAVIDAQSKKRHRAKGDAPLPSYDTPKKTKDVSLAEMKRQLSVEGITLDQIKALKEAGLAHKALTAAQKEEGLLISKRDAEEAIHKVGSAVKASFDKLDNDMPSLAGLSVEDLMKKWFPLKREGLMMLEDRKSEFWEDVK
jgi:hypothetical protein